MIEAALGEGTCTGKSHDLVSELAGPLVLEHVVMGNPSRTRSPRVTWRVTTDALMPVPNEAAADPLTGGAGDGGAEVLDDVVAANAAAARRFLGR